MATSPKAEGFADHDGERVPLTVFPRARDGACLGSVRVCIARHLPRVGSMLFRGFAVDSVAERRLIEELGARVVASERWAPWGRAHHGWSLVRCVGPASASRLVDLRELYRALPGAARARLVDRGLRYELELPATGEHGWQRVFRDRRAVAAWCDDHASSHVWLDDGSLRLTTCERAVHRHASGSLCWNPRAARIVGADGGTRRSLRHADGSPVERGLLRALAQTVRLVGTAVAWEPGDLLVVDHTLCGALDWLEWEDAPGLACTRIAVV